jgi:hypothetical protein
LPLDFIYFNLPPLPFLSPPPVPIDFLGLLFNHLFVFFEFLASYSIICLFSLNSLSVTNYLSFGDWPVSALSCALSCFCLGSAWAPRRWFLFLGRVGVAFIERRLSLLILFIIFSLYILQDVEPFSDVLRPNKILLQPTASLTLNDHNVNSFDKNCTLHRVTYNHSSLTFYKKEKNVSK